MDLQQRVAFYREEIPECRIVLAVLHPQGGVLLAEVQADGKPGRSVGLGAAIPSTRVLRACIERGLA